MPAFLACFLVGLALVFGTAGARAQTAEGSPTDLNEGKNAAQLFAADCQVCHAKPQGLVKDKGGLGLSSLSGFLRQHYTSSTQAASALAAYLTSAGPGPAAATPPGRRGMPSAEPAAIPRRGGEPPSENPFSPNRRASAPATDPVVPGRPPRRIPDTAAKPDGKPDGKPDPSRRPAATSAEAPKPAATEPKVEARPEPKSEPRPEAKPAPKPTLEEIFD